MAKQTQQTAALLIPDNPTIPKLQATAKTCRACDLWKTGTQTVFGEGGSHPRVMLVGEQPGDQEDIQGHPFVGPAGKLLDKALAEAGIDREQIYITNAVKHFKWEPRGKRRIHKKPNSMEIAACKPWLEAEIEALHPAVIVCLGATAAQALLGRQFKVSTQRGVGVPSPLAPFVMATVHPSALLRAPDEETRQFEMRRFIADLKLVHEALEKQKVV
jgi:uracil-DNA glycosylase family protein